MVPGPFAMAVLPPDVLQLREASTSDAGRLRATPPLLAVRAAPPELAPAAVLVPATARDRRTGFAAAAFGSASGTVLAMTTDAASCGTSAWRAVL